MERGWAVVTGASRGIGAAIAERLAVDGFGIIAVATTDEALASARLSIEQVGGRFEIAPMRPRRSCGVEGRDRCHPCRPSGGVGARELRRHRPRRAGQIVRWRRLGRGRRGEPARRVRAVARPRAGARSTCDQPPRERLDRQHQLGHGPARVARHHQLRRDEGCHRPPDPRPRGRARARRASASTRSLPDSSGRRCSTRTTRQRARRPSAAPIRWAVSVRPRRSQPSPRSSARSKPASSRAPSSPSTAASHAISPDPKPARLTRALGSPPTRRRRTSRHGHQRLLPRRHHGLGHRAVDALLPGRTRAGGRVRPHPRCSVPARGPGADVRPDPAPCTSESPVAASSSCSSTAASSASRPRHDPCDYGAGHLCFYVDGINAVFERLSGMGYVARSDSVVDITSGPNAGARSVYFADPDGYPVELFQRRPGG